MEIILTANSFTLSDEVFPIYSYLIYGRFSISTIWIFLILEDQSDFNLNIHNVVRRNLLLRQV